jgi:hypothetical protein
MLALVQIPGSCPREAPEATGDGSETRLSARTFEMRAVRLSNMKARWGARHGTREVGKEVEVTRMKS